LPAPALAEIDTIVFEMPVSAFEIDSARIAPFLFQDLAQLFSHTLPTITLTAGEVGQPRYLASGELPARALATFSDDIHWIPGVHGTVNLTSLPEAGADRVQFAGLNPPVRAAHAATTSLRLASDAINYDEPGTHVSYAKGPYGADATRISFSRTFSRRLTGALHAAFSNADGQFIDLPYKGHKARARFDYRLFRNWRLAYLHFNTRNQTGIAVPFFPEEWPAITFAFHKEERLYHALELAPSQRFFARVFYWQVKEELNDLARKIRPRLREAGTEAAWQKQREHLAISVHARAGSEQIQGNAIRPATRWYGNLAATFSLKLLPRFWLQSEAHYQHKKDWPAGSAFLVSGLWQYRAHTHFWLQLRRQRLPPALAEKESQFIYLSSNPQLQAVALLHLEGGFAWRRSKWDLQAQLGNSRWQNGLLFSAYSAAGPAYLRNAQRSAQALAARWQIRWQPATNFAVHVLGAQNLQKLPPHYWFWFQPEGAARFFIETRRAFFKKELEAAPRFAVRYLGERTSPVFSEPSVLPQFKTLPAVAVLDFHLRLRYGSGAMLFSWENLLQRKFELRDGVPDPGLVLRWGFQWTFHN